MSEILTLSETTKTRMKRLADRHPHEIMEARRHVMPMPMSAAAINAQSGFEPIGVLGVRIVGKLMSNLKKEMG
jgi:hypothetical protein